MRERPEAKIQKDLVAFLRNKGWHVMETHGNAFQSGFPDLYATHSRYGPRWIEVKLPDFKGSHFTASQLENFPKMCVNGSGVWIMTAANESEYLLLFKKYNWWAYLSIARH